MGSSPASGIAVLNAADRAAQMRSAGMGDIHPGTVAFLLASKVAKVNLRYGRIARILTAKGWTRWHALAVTEAYRLNELPDAELLALDPVSQKPTELPENLRALAGFGEFLKTQGAPPTGK